MFVYRDEFGEEELEEARLFAHTHGPGSKKSWFCDQHRLSCKYVNTALYVVKQGSPQGFTFYFKT